MTQNFPCNACSPFRQPWLSYILVTVRSICHFNILLTVHLSITLVNDQLEVKLSYFIIRYYRPLHVSRNVVLIIRRSNCTNTTSGIVTLCKWPSGVQVEREISTCTPDGHLQRVNIPDAVLVQFDLLLMSTTLLETCRGL